MTEEKLCPSCNQIVEDGAIYCGNCGYKLMPNVQPVTPVTSSGLPSYAVPKTHHKQHWAAIALIFGLLGIGGGFIVPILGISFGVIGLIFATSSLKLTHGWLKSIGLVVPLVALLLSIGVLVNIYSHNAKLVSSSTQSGTSNGVATISVTTPCYSLIFNTELNVNNSGSCSLNAYNSTTFQSSSDVYKIIASQIQGLSTSNFDNFVAQAIKSDISKHLSSFNITNKASSIFSGSPAYYVTAIDKSSGISFIEEAILHNSKKDNLFVIVHALNGQTINLNNLETTWQWNN